jgi:hypothetical protein
MLFRVRRDLGPQVKTVALISQSSKSFLVKNEIVNYNWKDLLGI